MGLGNDVLRLHFVEIGDAYEQLNREGLRTVGMQLNARGDGDAFIGMARLLGDVFDRAIKARRPRRAEQMLGRETLFIPGRRSFEVKIETGLGRFNGTGAAALGDCFGNGGKDAHVFLISLWKRRSGMC